MGKSLKRLLLLAALLAVFVPLQTRPASGYTFQSPQLLDNGPTFDTTPAALQASNGTLWVVWDSDRLVQNQVFYKTYNGTTWTSPKNLTWGPSYQNNQQPSIAQLQNGTIILAWSNNQTGHFNLWYKTLTGNVWSASYQFTESCPGCGKVFLAGDLASRMVLGTDGTLWVFWERDTFSSSCPILNACKQIFYKTLKGNVLSGDIQVTVDPTFNTVPGVSVVKDGSLRLTYSKFIAKGPAYSIFYRTFNGTQWSSEVSLTSSNFDLDSDIVQDRNGTLWLFWARDLTVGPSSFLTKLFYKFSSDAGQTWSQDTQLTFTSSSNDDDPFPVQSRDRSLWIFYDSDFLASVDIWYVKTNPIWPVHDVAVTKIQVSSGCVSPVFPACLYPYGDACSCVATVSVTVSDLGDFIENASLTVRAVNRTVFTLGSAWSFMAGGTSKVFTFNWNSSAVVAPPGRYTIIASVQQVPGEIIGASLDNVLSYRTLNVLLPGDLTKDGIVNIIDAGIMGASYNSRPGYPNWNPDADIARFGVVNIIDFGILGANYSKSI